MYRDYIIIVYYKFLRYRYRIPSISQYFYDIAISPSTSLMPSPTLERWVWLPVYSKLGYYITSTNGCHCCSVYVTTSIIAKQEVTTEIPNISTCVYLRVTKVIFVSVCPALSYSTSVRSTILIQSRIEYDRGRAYVVSKHVSILEYT